MKLMVYLFSVLFTHYINVAQASFISPFSLSIHLIFFLSHENFYKKQLSFIHLLCIVFLRRFYFSIAKFIHKFVKIANELFFVIRRRRSCVVTYF